MEEFLKPLGISQYRLAKDINVPPIRINAIIHGKRSISANTAIRLGKYFSNSAKFWLNLQTKYDFEIASNMVEKIKVFEWNKVNSGEIKAQILLKKFKFKCKRFSKEEMRKLKNKTPDFIVHKNKQKILYCECKKLEQDDRDFNEKNNYSLPDNTYDRISNKIKKACKQFKSVNANHKIPNVLFVYNECEETDQLDFVFTITGNLYSNEGTKIPALKKISEGKQIGKRKKIIDLCIWQNAKDNSTEYMFDLASPYFKKLCKLFEKDPKKLKRYI